MVYVDEVAFCLVMADLELIRDDHEMNLISVNGISKKRICTLNLCCVKQGPFAIDLGLGLAFFLTIFTMICV